MTNEDHLKNERVRSRILGVLEGFQAGASADVKSLEDEIIQLQAELDKAKQDSERLDWLETYITSKDTRPELGYKCTVWDLKVFSVIPKSALAKDSLREAIDYRRAHPRD